MSHRLFCAWLVSMVVWAASVAGAKEPFPPSPYDILGNQDLDTPLLDAVTYCRPAGLEPALAPVLEQAADGDWEGSRRVLADWVGGLDAAGKELIALDAVLFSRGAVERAELLASEERMRTLLRSPEMKDVALCLQLELARTLILLERYSEAAAQLIRARRWLEEQESEHPAIEAMAFWHAEIAYLRGRAFEAHIAYRELSHSEDARLALAAQLRLTDLAFDAGKTEEVSDQYEALLPRATAYGASIGGWARRAAEAALDAGDPGRAARWLERFVESGPERAALDVVEIRLADLDVDYGDPESARSRLLGVSSRREAEPAGALALVRAVDLGVWSGSAGQRIDQLFRVIRDQRQGVRRYALGELMNQLRDRDDLDGALAVATRLAYEGVDPVVLPRYAETLDGLLELLIERRDDRGECAELVRALGGRYGILIERASKPEPFAQVGECFEQMELPWLAAKLYRAVSRRFGNEGAERIALPLARVSVATGEVPLARQIASAALEDASKEEKPAWRAILAEADFLEGRFDAAAESLKEIVDLPALVRERGRLLRLLALTLEESRRRVDVEFVADRAPRWLAEGVPAPGARAATIEAAMLAAHAHRHAERLDAAYALYRVVDERAEDGALRSSARFWLGLGGERRADGDGAWGEDPAETMGAPWGRYALFERRFATLEDAYGEKKR